MTFYYDDQMAGRGGKQIGSTLYYNDFTFTIAGKVKTVVFDASFANYTGLTDLSYCFNDFSKLAEVKGIENLNTENVTTMNSMFHGTRVESLDLSSLNTSKVEDMGSMFWGCSKLKTLNMSGLNVENLKTLFGLVAQCPKLESLDLSGWNTKNVTSTAFMFNGTGLKNVDLSGWNTENLMETHFMFSGESVETIDLSGWDTKNVTSAYAMFSNCPNLTTIYVTEGWSTESFDTGGDAASYTLFMGCEKLVGGQGTTYSGTGADFARIDGGASAPGYLTYKDPSGIRSTKTNARTDEAVYSLSGQRLKAPRKGVNIIGGRKFVVK